MRLAFMGSPAFALPALQALIDARHEVACVYSQPARPAGRGRQERPTPVAAFAQERGLMVRTPKSLKNKEAQEAFAALALDAAIVVAYGLLLPKPILDAPRLGAFNLHASLLPRWRGAAPIQRAMLAGDAVTGVTIMQVVPALDAGAMLLKGEVPITEDDTAQGLHDALAQLGGRLMVEALGNLENLDPEPQDEALVTYAEKLQKAEAPLDWRRPALELSRQVRAFNSFPVAQATMNGETWRIWFARTADGEGVPGTLLSTEQGILVACGNGALRIEELQKPGGRRLAWRDFLAGTPLKPGMRFDA